MGNIKDAKLEKLADKGNGHYAYIDSLDEARKVLIEQMTGTLVTIAKDVKIQVEFNPAKAVAYRLIGYENRLLAKEDFNDDTKDAGEIGAGHTVTALYEVVPVGAKDPANPVDKLKYQEGSPKLSKAGKASGELLTVKLRYKQPDGSVSKLLAVPVTDKGAKFNDASKDFKFAAAVASFGMILRRSPHAGTYSLAAAAELAGSGAGKDPKGRRAEFVGMVKAAQALKDK
jgi:Ca-activated chloride channel family protein